MRVAVVIIIAGAVGGCQFLGQLAEGTVFTDNTPTRYRYHGDPSAIEQKDAK